MILLNDFFTIRDTESSPTEIWAELVINANHKIFEGHFPNQPVVPGVCQMQMIKEIVEHVTRKQTNLAKAADMKFLAVIDPRQNNLIHATIKMSTDENGAINIVASLFKDELVHFKCKGQLQVSDHLAET
jgi:3-hydroxyacyl-[acyl-carrier-protein] dehydratase